MAGMLCAIHQPTSCPACAEPAAAATSTRPPSPPWGSPSRCSPRRSTLPAVAPRMPVEYPSWQTWPLQDRSSSLLPSANIRECPGTPGAESKPGTPLLSRPLEPQRFREPTAADTGRRGLEAAYDNDACRPSTTTTPWSPVSPLRRSWAPSWSGSAPPVTRSSRPTRQRDATSPSSPGLPATSGSVDVDEHLVRRAAARLKAAGVSTRPSSPATVRLASPARHPSAGPVHRRQHRRPLASWTRSAHAGGLGGGQLPEVYALAAGSPGSWAAWSKASG